MLPRTKGRFVSFFCDFVIIEWEGLTVILITGSEATNEGSNFRL